MKTIAVASGKGGVGKTTLTANLGAALASKGQRVVLFDADLGLANLDVVLGLRPDTNIKGIVDGVVRMKDAAVEDPAGLRVITGTSGIGSMLRLGRKRLEAVLMQTEELRDDTDILIFDAASGADSRVMSVLKFADQAVLVTTPEPAGIIDCYSTAKVLFRYKKEAEISIIVNMVRDRIQADKAFETIESATHKFLRKHVEYLGCVRQDDEAAQITCSRRPFVIVAPHLCASRDVNALADALIETQPAHDSKEYAEALSYSVGEAA